MEEHEERLKDLKLRRGVIKRKLTNFHNFVRAVKSNDLLELEVRIRNFEPILQQFEELQVLIEKIVGTEEESHERDPFEDKYYKALATAKGLLKDAEPVKQRKETSNSKVKLPPIHLPIFSGYTDRWMEFHDSFTSLIIRNTELDDVERLHYLRASLRGEAMDVIESLPITEKNFQVAWNLLVSSYQNSLLII